MERLTCELFQIKVGIYQDVGILCCPSAFLPVALVVSCDIAFTKITYDLTGFLFVTNQQCEVLTSPAKHLSSRPFFFFFFFLLS